jgi:hypothetical protein
VSRTRSLVGPTAVTHLASAAVAEFYHTKPDEDARQDPLRLCAPDASVAHYVLTLVALPHTTTDPTSTGNHRRPPALTRPDPAVIAGPRRALLGKISPMGQETDGPRGADRADSATIIPPGQGPRWRLRQVTDIA